MIGCHLTEKIISSNIFYLFSSIFRIIFFQGSTRTRIVLDVKSRPDPPSGLKVTNVTHNSVHLTWSPGFHGGMDQHFRIKYVKTKDRDGRMFQTHDVYPANVHSAVLHGLEAGEQYQLRIMAFNNIGESNYTSGQPVIITTPGKDFDDAI